MNNNAPIVQSKSAAQVQPTLSTAHGYSAPPPNAILVSHRQQGNPLLKHIKNVRWVHADIVPDYLCGESTAVLFLSLRFHLLRPDYIHGRIKSLQRAFRLRVILCHIDTEDAVEPLAQVTRAAIGNECTLLCAFSTAEAAKYLEILKACENRPAESIQKDVGNDYVSRLTAALTTVRGVNKADVKTLGDAFGSVANILRASQEQLQSCPGVGPTKARRLYEAFHEPFRKDAAMLGLPPRQQTGEIGAGDEKEEDCEEE